MNIQMHSSSYYALLALCLLSVGCGEDKDDSDLTMPQYACKGEALICSWFENAADCFGQRGCAWGTTCEGSRDPCSSWSRELLCNSSEGCSWNNGSCTLTGSRRSCGSFTNPSSCPTSQGCTEGSRCLREPNPCSTFEREVSCIAQVNCDWRPELGF